MGPLAVDPAAAAGKRLTRPRPGHADLAGGMKYGATDLRDVLERASARESAARVAAGAVCKLLLARVRHRGPRAASSRSASVVDDGVAALASRRSRRCARTRRCARSTPSLEPKMVAAVDAAKSDGETLGGVDPRRRARRAGGPRDASPPGTASSTAASARRCSRCRRSRRWSSASAIEASRGPGSRAHDEIEHGPGRRAPAPHQPRRRARGRRHQRRGRRRRRLHEADLDARAGPRLGRPRDRRAARARPTSAATSPRFPPAASSARRCSRSCWPTPCWS